MLDEAETFVNAAAVLKERGAYKIYVMVTHGLLSGDAIQRIEHSDIDEVSRLLFSNPHPSPSTDAVPHSN